MIEGRLGSPQIHRLRDHLYKRYRRFKVGEGGKKMEFVQLAVLKGQPNVPKDLEEICGKLPFLQKYRNCGRDERQIKGYIDAFDLLRKVDDNMRVVYGQPGIGKTALLTHVCGALARKETESDYSLVFYFPLRDKGVSSAKNLEDLLSFYSSRDKKLDLSEVIQSLVESKEKQVLLFLDGADEVRDLLISQKGNIFQEILEGRTLPQADVIVSSRPGSLPFLQPHSTSFYELHGFDEASIKRYVNDFFRASPERAEKMMKELQSRPDLMGGAHIPMNLNIFCSIYEGSELPPTMTLCYRYSICSDILRECKKYGISCQIDPSLNHLPDDMKSLLASLGELAYEGMMKTPPTFVFEEENILRSFPNLKPGAPIHESLFKGLLCQHTSSVGHVTRSTFNFSHTTRQEFLCAYHLCHLPTAKQLDFLIMHFSNLKFSMVLRFFAGLTGLSSREISECLCQPNYTLSFLDSSQSLSLPSKCSNDNPHLLYLFHFLYESQNSQLAQNIAQHLNQSLVFGLFLTSHDALAISYCLSKCTRLRDLTLQCLFYDLHLPSLPRVLTILKVNVRLLSLELGVTYLSTTNATSLISGTAVETLWLTVEQTTLAAVSAIFTSTTIRDLTLLVLSPPTDSDIYHRTSELTRLVAENTTLRKLALSGSSYYKTAVLHGLAASASIEDLTVLGPIDGSVENVAETLATCVVSPKLRRVMMSHHPPLPVMKVLTTREVPLEELEIYFPPWEKDTEFPEEHLKEMERNTAKIRVVKIDFNVSHNTRMCDAVSIGLGENKSLREVTLSSVPKEKKQFVQSKLSSVTTVHVH